MNDENKCLNDRDCDIEKKCRRNYDCRSGNCDNGICKRMGEC